MESTVFVGQTGNGGAAMKSGNHASQKSAGGSGRLGGGATDSRSRGDRQQQRSQADLFAARRQNANRISNVGGRNVPANRAGQRRQFIPGSIAAQRAGARNRQARGLPNRSMESVRAAQRDRIAARFGSAIT